jgi:cell division protease FtsH
MVGFIALILYAFVSVASSTSPTSDMALSEFIGNARANAVESIEAKGPDLRVRLRADEQIYKVRISSDTSIEELLRAEGVDLSSIELQIKSDAGADWAGVLLSFLPLLIIIGIVIYFLRGRGRAGALGGKITKSGARQAVGRSDVTFDDVAGVDEAKEELAEVVDFLRQPERYRAIGARVPRGILLMGPPGTGKTYIAKAVAGEAAVPFYAISGSQFVELYVGVGAARVRDLFREAKENAPCIVFIDELDAVGRQRGAGLGGGHDEREQTLNQILVELDGFEPEANVIVLAATNRPDILDSALIRPGRFDRQVVLGRPDMQGRLAILKVHARKLRFEENVQLETIAKQTVGLVGADLENLLNESALLAARHERRAIHEEDLDEALDRVTAGPQRKSHVMSLAERRRIAVHEAGHAIVAHHLPLADRVSKISIVPRGIAGGYTRFAPETDRDLQTREELKQRITAFLGGRAAERLVLSDLSTGAEDDIERATTVARQMVTRWGMSDALGPRTFGRKQELVFLGRDLGEQRNYSEHVAEQIDSAIGHLVSDAEQKATEILQQYRAHHHALVQLLLEQETLTGPPLADALAGVDPRDRRDATPNAASDATGAGESAQPFKEPPVPRWLIG